MRDKTRREIICAQDLHLLNECVSTCLNPSPSYVRVCLFGKIAYRGFDMLEPNASSEDAYTRTTLVREAA